MNLASRCREAISHVAVLKKELAMHQRRAAEALAAQRQSMQRRVDSDCLVTNTDVEVEMDRMDRIIAAHAPLPQQPMPKVTAKLKTKNMPDTKCEEVNSFQFEGATPPMLPKSTFVQEENELPGLGDEVMVSTLARTMFPHSPSPKIMDDIYNESFPVDLPQLQPRKLGSHFHAPALMESDQDDRSYSSSISDDRSAFSTQSEAPQGTVSSVDAFEASFATTFPSSFSNSKDEELCSDMVQPAIYNPFVPSPPKVSKIGGEEDVASVGVRDRSPMRRKVSDTAVPKTRTLSPYSRSALTTVPASPQPSEEREAKIIKPKVSIRTSSPAPLPTMPRSRISRDATTIVKNDMPPIDKRSNSPSLGSRLFMRVSPPQSLDTETPEKMNGGTAMAFTSPTFSTPVDNSSPEPSPDPEQPRRPEKTPSATARARYEKALQPRSFIGSSTTRNVGRLGSNNRFLNSDGEEDDEAEHAVTDPDMKPLSSEPLPVKSSGVKSPSLVLKRLQQRRVKERMSLDGRTVDVSDSASVASLSSTTSGLSTNSDQLSTLSGASNSVSRVESRRRLVALRLAKINQEQSSSTPFDIADGTRVGSMHTMDGVDEIMGRTDASSSFSISFPAQDVKKYVDGDSANRSVIWSKGYGSTTNSESSNLSPDSMMKESRALDAIATTASRSKVMSPPPNADAATSRFATAGKLRRSVQQPISYAEPTLNSKLRRGDIFFEKDQQGTHVVSPPQETDDVLNDLTGAPVRT